MNKRLSTISYQLSAAPPKERFALANRTLPSGALADRWRLWWQACRLLLLLSAISYQPLALAQEPSAFAQAPASGQTAPRPPSATATYGAAGKPRMTEPLEKPGMPPAYIYRLE